MDVNVRDFYYPFSWRKPLLYIIIFISILLYFVIFYIYKENGSFGEIYPAKSFKIAIISISTVILIPAWKFYKYDTEKINAYNYIFPFKNSPYFKKGETILFSDIKSFNFHGGLEGGGVLISSVLYI